MSIAASRHADFNQLLPAFIAGDVEARKALPRHAARYLLKIASQYGADLPEDLLGEVVSQTFLKLLGLKPGDFDPDQRRAGTFMGLVVRGAVRDVRAAYVPPGQPKRDRKHKARAALAKSAADADEPVDHASQADAPADAYADAEMVDPGSAGVEEVIEDYADPTDAAEMIEIRLDLRKALERAPYPVAMGLVRQFLYGDGLGEAAAAMGLSRFALNRQINRFNREFQAAA